MLKYIVCLIAGTLVAETVHHVEFQFPPSNYEWKLLLNDQSIADLFEVDDEDKEEDAVENFKVYAHREGDALEILTVATYSGIQEIDVDEEETLETVQATIDETINAIFPNHRYLINAYYPEKGEADGFIEWELNDGVQDIAHGFIRAISSRKEEQLQKALLCYFTTASKNDHNKYTWTEVLNSARILD